MRRLDPTTRFSLFVQHQHESLTMVNNYLAIAQTDVQAAHIDASLVTNWTL